MSLQHVGEETKESHRADWSHAPGETQSTCCYKWKGKLAWSLFRWPRWAREIKKTSALALSGRVLSENTPHILIKAINLVKEDRTGGKMELSHCNQEWTRKKKYIRREAASGPAFHHRRRYRHPATWPELERLDLSGESHGRPCVSSGTNASDRDPVTRADNAGGNGHPSGFPRLTSGGILARRKSLFASFAWLVLFPNGYSQYRVWGL